MTFDKANSSPLERGQICERLARESGVCLWGLNIEITLKIYTNAPYTPLAHEKQMNCFHFAFPLSRGDYLF